MAAEAVVRARIDAETKHKASRALEAMGLSVSDAIRMMMVRVAADQALPFAVKAPNAQTREAMDELDRGKGRRANSADALFKDLGL